MSVPTRACHSEGPSWAGVVKLFVPWLGSVERLAAEAAKVTEIDLDTRLFLHWHQTTVQVGWAAPRAFIVFALLQHPPDQIPADIGVPRFLSRTVSTEIEQMLDAVAANDNLWQLLGGAPVDLAERVEALRRPIQAAGRTGLPGN